MPVCYSVYSGSLTGTLCCHREHLVTRDLCKEARTLSDHPCAHQNAPTKKVFVFLNPEANHQ